MCSSASTRPTGSSSSSRSGEGPCPSSRRRASLFALAHVPEGLARSLLDDVVSGDARLAWRGGCVALAAGDAEQRPARARVVLRRRPRDDRALSRAGRRSARSARCASRRSSSRARSRRSPTRASGCRCSRVADGDRRRRAAPRAVGSARGAAVPRVRRRRGARRAQRALRRVASSTRGASGSRAGASPVRSSTRSGSRGGCSRDALSRVGLASLAHFFGTAARPCHRALPDAQATAEILLALIGLAQERGARTVERPRRALRAAAAPRLRQAQPRVRRADAAGRLPLPRRERPGAVRRPRARPARAAAFVLPLRAAAAGGRGGA